MCCRSANVTAAIAVAVTAAITAAFTSAFTYAFTSAMSVSGALAVSTVDVLLLMPVVAVLVAFGLFSLFGRPRTEPVFLPVVVPAGRSAVPRPKSTAQPELR